LNEISRVIRYYLSEAQKGKDSPKLWVKFDKTFLKYFADQMKDNFPGRRISGFGFASTLGGLTFNTSAGTWDNIISTNTTTNISANTIDFGGSSDIV